MHNQHSKPVISIVSAVHGVEPYIDKFISSIVKQTIGINNLELILVDDCSNDGSYEKCLKWERKYPALIKLHRLDENRGQGNARNFGIQLAKGKWLNFADPDDFLDKDFFKSLIKASKLNPKAGLIIGQLRSYYPSRLFKSINDHALGWRFKGGTKLVNVISEPSHIHLHVNCALFKREDVIDHKVCFDPNLRPTFEDGLFTNQYTIRSGNFYRLTVQEALYYYRKRDEKNSTIDTAWNKKEQFLNVPRYGSLALLKEAHELYPVGLPFIYTTVVYNLCWFFRKNFRKSLCDTPLTKSEAKECIHYLGEALKLIPAKYVQDFDLVSLREEIKFQMLSIGGHEWKGPRSLRVIDAKQNRARIAFYTCSHSDDNIHINGEPAKVISNNDVPDTLLGEPVANIRYQWIQLPNEPTCETEFSCSGQKVKFVVNGKWAARNRRNRNAIATKITGSSTHFTLFERLLLRKAKTLGEIEQKDCWVFYDRLQKADDNAEHLYRYVNKHHPDINAFFVLHKNSSDWQRLKSEGFNLLAFDSTQHKCALINASHIISSHAEVHMFRNLDMVAFASETKAKYHFLQHGTISNDLSKWLNEKPLSTFVTTTKPEYDSIAHSDCYAFSEDVVTLSGQPRHDRLIEIAKASTKKKILIMPTWRKWLVKKGNGPGEWNPIINFADTDYCQNWKGLIHSEALKNLYEQGYEIEFYLHTILSQYADDFELPHYVKLGTNEKESIQHTFGTSEIMVTDYSSVAFEMALQRKPVIYFHFDYEKMFDGSHTYQRGYFDYETQGFGPVFHELDQVTKFFDKYQDEREHLVESIVIPRADMQIPHNDGKCCERLVDRIKAS
ncbi:bifunctional glycosyltransferase/CDP-glycerol:glycerophosphate glycerophosphotransferase [Vibrio owensii]|uniref:bifunctional glycosyltransferase/CDP-glycerol:glycerophosphate glycerophosphotransferase n=1 Tax=Vibrio owensii TaxID=696485 RepID=UPI0018F20213|nr:CDP-glycerol glycerophosphotransferase family protein [Vibrio owensii]